MTENTAAEIAEKTTQQMLDQALSDLRDVAMHRAESDEAYRTLSREAVKLRGKLSDYEEVARENERLREVIGNLTAKHCDGEVEVNDAPSDRFAPVGAKSIYSQAAHYSSILTAGPAAVLNFVQGFTDDPHELSATVTRLQQLGVDMQGVAERIGLFQHQVRVAAELAGIRS